MFHPDLHKADAPLWGSGTVGLKCICSPFAVEKPVKFKSSPAASPKKWSGADYLIWKYNFRYEIKTTKTIASHGLDLFQEQNVKKIWMNGWVISFVITDQRAIHLSMTSFSQVLKCFPVSHILDNCKVIWLSWNSEFSWFSVNVRSFPHCWMVGGREKVFHWAHKHGMEPAQHTAADNRHQLCS